MTDIYIYYLSLIWFSVKIDNINIHIVNDYNLYLFGSKAGIIQADVLDQSENSIAVLRSLARVHGHGLRILANKVY